MSQSETVNARGGAKEEHLLASLLESINDLVWCTSVDGQRLLFVNSAAERIYGHSLDELKSNRDLWIQTVHPEDRAHFQRNLAELVNQEGVEREYRIVRSDGEIRWLRERITVVRDAAGKPLRLGGIATDITDRKRAEEALRDSEAIYHSLVESLPLSVLRKDLKGRIVFGNRYYCEAMGATLDELLGKTDFDLFPAELAKKFTGDDRKVKEDGEVLRDVEEHRNRDGEQTYVEVLKGPVRDASGRTVGIQVLFWDVTDQRRAEEERAYERHLLHTLLENAPDNIYFKDTESRFIRVSRALTLKFGLTDPEQAIGRTDADFFSAEHARQALADEQEVMRTGEPILEKIERETWSKHADTWCATSKLPLHDVEGNVIGTFGISRDVTEQKRAAAELSRERDLLKTIINNVPDLIFVKDRAGRFVAANSALLDTLDLEHHDDIVGKTDYDFSPPDMACNYVADDQIVMRRGAPLFDQEEGLLDGNGNELWLLTTKVPLKNDEGDVTGLVGIGRNITKRKQAEDELRAAKVAADAANRSKSDFLANMSHEIRTPMNAIIGMTELLLDTDLSTPQRDYLRMVQESGESLLTLINDILDFSKIEAGKLDLDCSVFDLRENLGDTMRSLALRAHSKNLELAFRVEPDVPNMFVGDSGRLRQIVVNLVGNAIKFTEQGEVVVDVRCSVQSTNYATLQVTVKDTGIGIPEDKCASIFNEFEQADSSTTRRFGGTGLGLAISARLVNLMNGRIWVESQLGKGSKFHFSIDFGLTDVELPTRTANAPVIVGGTPVLIVDDNRTNRLILNEMLNNWGMHPTTTASADEARDELVAASLRGEPFRILLSDVNMPDVDGFTLAEWIRQDETVADIPIIMLTSSGRPGDGERRKNLGIYAHLLKPVKQSELFDVIVQVLGVTGPEDQSGDLHLPAESSIEPLRILLAEDNVINQRLALGVLGKQGHHVTIAHNGQEAVDAIQKQKFDLVLMDVQMPEMDGFEATRTIREQEQGTTRHIPIIAMTAHAMKGDRELCVEAGMDEYVSKPIRSAQLFEKLAMVTGDGKPTVPVAEVPPEVVDWEATMATVDGQRELLDELLCTLLDELPNLRANIRVAIEENDAEKLNQGAHLLKGSLAFFNQTPAAQMAQTLEDLGGSGELSDARTVFEELETRLARLKIAVEEYLAKTRVSEEPT